MHARQSEAPAIGTREPLTGLGDRLGMVRRVAGQPTWSAVDPNANDNLRSFPPPEITESTIYGDARLPTGASMVVPLLTRIEARPPALRARCGRMV